ncbi:MAG: hypothetical protein SH850_04880 [Planctomycetaceae bacterium]|nr:hypothetical protein [Planctomycetaceae bacterium]
MKYLFDNDISPRFAQMLRALEIDVVALREIMPADTKDADFLGDLKRRHSIDVFISNNSAQRTNRIEAALLKSSGVTALYFNPFWGSLRLWGQAKWLINHWEKIEGFVRGAAPGTCADIQARGRLSLYRW